MGDLNINLLNYEAHSDTNEFINSMVSHYLLPQNLQPARVTDHSATIIDNIFTNATEFDTVSGNILNQLADHFSQFLVIKKLPITHKDATYQYDYSNFEKDKFLADFLKINWNETQNFMPADVNGMFYICHEKVTKFVRDHVPLTKLSRKKLSSRLKPWISIRVEYMMAKRDKYLRKFNRTKSMDMEHLCKKFRNKVVSEIREGKIDYYSQYFTRDETNMIMLWSGIHSVVNFGSNVGSRTSSLTHDGLKIDDSKKIANIFNEVFVNTAQKINGKIPRTRKLPLDYLSSRSDESFFISPVPPDEIKVIVSCSIFFFTITMPYALARP